jgi:putative tryptophan/tyrosine transport system substrate-binding protein
MRRRELIALLGGALFIWPLAARAQQSGTAVIGLLDSGSAGRNWVAAFREGLAEAGYVEGRNVAIEYRWAEGRYDRLPGMAADLVRRGVAVIVATSTPPALAAKGATTAIPIVFTTGSDPVEFGLVASLSRPGGNLTGVTRLNLQLGPKRLQLLHELLPKANRMALLVNPTNPNAEIFSREVRAEGSNLGLQILVLQASTEPDLIAALEKLGELQAGGLLIGPDPFFNTRSEQLAALTIAHRVPTIYQYREFASAGGLMSYGGSLADSHRLVGIYTGRILGGAKPADLPVQQSTKLELIINLKTAKTLGLEVPSTLLAGADEVIE